jgi:hypothetical protein
LQQNDKKIPKWGFFLWYNTIDCKGTNMAKSMYDIIKKQNGEHFAKAIRNYDNGIFDVPNIDKIVKYAGPDAEPGGQPQCSWIAEPGGQPQCNGAGVDIAIDVAGDGFLYNMVRIMAGTLIAVAEKKISPHDIPDITRSCDRRSAGATAPACGLFLNKVVY